MVFAELDGDQILLRTSWDEKELVKQVSGASWSSSLRMWRAPLSWATCVTLRGVFQGKLEIGPVLNAWGFGERQARVDPAMQLRHLLEPTWNLDPFANDHDGRLFPYQVVAREFMRVAGSGLLGDEMGTGKTIQLLALLRALGSEAFPALLVCPNTIKDQWRQAAVDWLSEATPYVVTGNATQRRRILEEAAEDPTALVIINIEAVRQFSKLKGYGSIRLARCTECDRRHGDPSLKTSACETHEKELNRIPFRATVLDEAHRVKDPKAKQTRAIWALFHNHLVRYRWALTGTPIANNPGDLWSVMHTVAPADFPRKTSYIDRYALLSYNIFGGMEIVGVRPDTKDELFAILDPRFRRVTKDLVLKFLPPKIRTTRVVTMSPRQKKAYDEISRRLVTRLDDGTLLVAKSNLTAQTRLLQLASSYAEIVRDPEDPEDPAKWTVNLTEPSPKVDELVEIIGELNGGSLAVVAEHRKLIELASKRLEKLGVPHVLVTGAVHEAVRAANITRFQAGEVPVLLFTYKAGGVGVNLTRAGTLVRLQRSWSLVDNKQGEDRVHRIGSEQHDSVNIIDLVTEGTIELQQLERLAAKFARLEEITRDRERRIQEGLPVDDLIIEETQIMSSYLGDAE